MGDFKDLRVWKESKALTCEIYAVTSRFPASEQFGLVSQLRRAAVSINANIPEGNGRYSPRDQARHYRIAIGSACEVEALLIVASELEMLPLARAHALVSAVGEVQRMLSGLANYCLSRAKRTRDEP